MFLGGPLVCTCAACKAVAAMSALSIRQETDARLINRIANHPDVRPTFGYHEGETDLSPLFDHQDAYVVISDGDGAASLFEWSAPGVWQGHSLFLPDSRGEYGIAAARAMCRWMFEHRAARILWGMTPVDHRAAQMFNRLVGFKAVGECTDAANVRCRLFMLEDCPW